MRRHASADELASYAAGDMRPRKAAKIAAHLEVCAHCQEVSSELQGVSVMLASVSFAPMPDDVSARIETALAAEASQRLASAPATEAGRRDLPVRHRRPVFGNWKLPRISSPMALRVMAATGAAVIVVGGAYELASHGQGSTSGPAATGAAAPSHGRGAPSVGSIVPQMYAGPAGRERPVPTIVTKTQYTPANLQAQVAAVVSLAGKSGELKPASASSGVTNSGLAGPEPTASTGPLHGVNSPAQSAADRQLIGCVDRVTAGRIPLLVDIAYFEGKRATIIIFAAVRGVPAQALVVGSACSKTSSDVLDHQVLKHV